MQNAKDQYGNADVHLNVTYTAGALSTDNGKTSISGLQAGALNVVVTDQIQTAGSGMAGTTAVSLINANSSNKEDLPHEMAHQFMGDTRGFEANMLKSDPTGIGRFVDNMFMDVTNDYGRFLLNHVPAANAGPTWHDQAKSFQQAITPTTKQ